MAGRHEGRVVIVTGAGRGIGRATAAAFAAEGAEVALLGRSAGTLAEAEAAVRAAGGGAQAFVCDVRDAAAVRAAVDAAHGWHGRIDALVSNAGVSGDGTPFLTTGEAEWDDVVAVNLKGAFLVGQAVARRMAEGAGGAILHTASIAGLATDGAFSPYSAAKAGVLALTRSMAVELAPHRIRVNAVSPGYTRTDMTMQYFPPEMRDFLDRGFARVPMRRVVEAEEVAKAFLFLASDDASGITGANLVVDGGLTANLYIMETMPAGAAGPG